MADRFTEISQQGLGGNLLDSIKGVAVGGLLFLLSFVVLWWNEGLPDLSKVAQKARQVNPAAVESAADGKLVSVSGPIKSAQKLGDDDLLLPGDYVKLTRTVEMYAWVEHEQSKTDKQVGGGKRTETTYTYDKSWTENPRPAASFRYGEGHENPSLPLQGATRTAPSASVGAYSFTPSDAQMPAGQPVRLRQDMLRGSTATADKAPTDARDSDDADTKPARLKAPDAQEDDDTPHPAVKHKRAHHHGRHAHHPARPLASSPADQPARHAISRTAPAQAQPTYRLANDTYLFRGTGSIDSPHLGDVRVSFQAVPQGFSGTLFGELHGSEVKSYHKGDVDFYRFVPGGREEAIQTLATEHKLITWILRAVGFFMMWIGLMLFFGPINAILDIIPFLGSAGRFLIGIVMLPAAMMLSLVTILLSIIAHNPILLVLTLGGLVGGGYYFYLKRKARPA